MKPYNCFWVFAITLFCVLQISSSLVEPEAKEALFAFLGKLSNNNIDVQLKNGWLAATDPCIDRWRGVECNTKNTSISKLLLSRSDLSGILDTTELCSASSISRTLSFLVLNRNNITGVVPTDISICDQLTHLYIGWNQFKGLLPHSLASLKNLKRLDISHNLLEGHLPNLIRISGLKMLAVEFNQLSGEIPALDFSNFVYFNVSYNNFNGPMPDVKGYFNETSFYGNPLLCGYPSPRMCPKSGSPRENLFIYSGYSILFLVLISVIFVKLYKRQGKMERRRRENKVAITDKQSEKKTLSGSAIETKTGLSRSELLGISAESTSISHSTSLAILTNPAVNRVKFDDLLSAPAELLGRGRYSTLYKVEYGNGMVYAVKRIKEWGISCEDFEKRMQRIGQVKHANVLPVISFRSSKQEKLLVYEYQQNGSLLGLLQGTKAALALEWGCRLEIAAKIADALAHFHRELHEDGIGHGNLNSSNVMLNKDMEPCISEYGLNEASDQDCLYASSLAFPQGLNPPDQKPPAESDPSSNTFERDVYSLGVILLELLTGRAVQSNSTFDLTKWVHCVVREEWTVEVFDKSLISEGASEERMVYLLQVALKCVNKLPEARPSSAQVASMINMIKEEEEKPSNANEP